MDKRVKFYLIFMCIFTMITTVCAVSFAFINKPSFNNNGFNTLASFGGEASLYYSLSLQNATNTNLSLTISEITLENFNNTNIVSSQTLEYSLKVINGQEGITCDYDLYYTPTVTYTTSPDVLANGKNEVEVCLNNKCAAIDNLSSKTKIDSGTLDHFSNYSYSIDYFNTINIYYRFNLYPLYNQTPVIGKNISGIVDLNITSCEVSSNEN